MTDAALLQRKAALARANVIRCGMAKKRRELASLPRAEGLLLAADWFDSPDDTTGRMKVGDVLESVRQIGPHYRDSLLAAAGLTGAAVHRRISIADHGNHRNKGAAARPLTDRARQDLARTLRERAT